MLLFLDLPDHYYKDIRIIHALGIILPLGLIVIGKMSTIPRSVEVLDFSSCMGLEFS